ncbi:hypothetical protein GFS31_22730 [Leptolyngbya sp. BL0902]|nr:hypothetical protein GFS31_22730 [Leptolyngbya sp. BL0902]
MIQVSKKISAPNQEPLSPDRQCPERFPNPGRLPLRLGYP